MTIIAIFGDPHIGGSTALSTPTYSIHTGRADETTVCYANSGQNWLWSNWQDYWAHIYRLACDGHKHKTQPIVTICLGDLIDGNHHGTSQIMPEVQDQVALALDILQPIRDMSDKFYGVLGTEAHAGNNHDIEHQIYRTLQADAFDYQLTLSIDGKVIDVAHASPMASLPAMYRIIGDYENLPRPDYIIRGHRHLVTDTGLEDRYTRMIVCPSWQLKTSYAKTLSNANRRSDIGGIIINNGILDVSRLRYMAAPDERKIIYANN
jgi:hypothetical protein